MMYMPPREAEFLTVEFAKPGSDQVHKQRVTVLPRMREPGQRGIAHVIQAAVKGCKRKGIAVANVLRITHKKSVLFDYVPDTAERLR